MDTYTGSRTSHIFCILGSSLLGIMALFHGSGFFYVSDAITNSNAEGFLKDIVPVLFAHPSIHLLGLMAFGILSLFLKQDKKKVLLLLIVLIGIDALLGFFLGGFIPGALLSIAALCFLISLNKKKQTQVLETGSEQP